MLNIFKQGTAHLAIVVENPKTMVTDTEALTESLRQGTDMQMAASQTLDHGVMGITTLEKIIEKILSTAILDEKDVEKRQMSSRGSHHGHEGIIDANQYSMTILNEESKANMDEMTELLNDTAKDVIAHQNHLSDEQKTIFNTKFAQLFSQRLTNDVKRDIEALSANVHAGSNSRRYASMHGVDTELKENLLDHD
jgi:methylphosphotriester-DNA--protein-cysteine methyltransferase